MNTYCYRTPNFDCKEPWKDCLFNDKSQLDAYKAETLVSFNGQPVIQQHHTTYLTGKETSHAHHFAKMMAVSVLDGEYRHAPSITVNATTEKPSVLWIDTVRGPHACATFFSEMTAHMEADDKRFHLLCLDMLGSFREEYWELTRQVEAYIDQLRPTLVVIDDIDHLMPYGGINVASELNKIVRDTVNHTTTAFLFVGYNHLNKKASTTGNIGKMLFSGSDSVFSVSTQHVVSRVRLVRSYEILTNLLDHPDHEFQFSIADDNLPHEVVKTAMDMQADSTGRSGFMSQTILRDIICEVVNPGEPISPDQLTLKLNERSQQLNRMNRSRTLIAQAVHLGILHKADGTNDYIIPTHPTPCNPVHNPDNLTHH